MKSVAGHLKTGSGVKKLEDQLNEKSTVYQGSRGNVPHLRMGLIHNVSSHIRRGTGF